MAATDRAIGLPAPPAAQRARHRLQEEGGYRRTTKGRIARSAAAKHTFEAQTGYPHGRPGYVVDHIKPLACGGVDAPSNMQWQTIVAARAKDKVERAGLIFGQTMVITSEYTPAMCTRLLTLAVLVAVAGPVRAQEPGAPSAISLRMLQVSFVGLQAADLHSTFRAVDSGTCAEGNPLMTNRASALVLKVGVSVAVLAATRKWATKHPRAARITLAALDGAYAAIVVNNYRIGSP